jgi:hypothetical protein
MFLRVDLISARTSTSTRSPRVVLLRSSYAMGSLSKKHSGNTLFGSFAFILDKYQISIAILSFIFPFASCPTQTSCRVSKIKSAVRASRVPGALPALKIHEQSLAQIVQFLPQIPILLLQRPDPLQ